MQSYRARLIRKLKKYHKWPGIILSLFLLLFATSGILLNHRNLISSADISRKWMPPGYQYKNWNLAAVRAGLPIGHDSLLVYGNIGIWLTNNNLSGFTNFNNGFPEGIDERKIYSVVPFRGLLVAGTQFGVYSRSTASNRWDPVSLPGGEVRISDLSVKGDTLLILTRDHLYLTTDLKQINEAELPPPEGYVRKASLFLTLWELHSGELFGFIGKLFTDLLGIVLAFLTITGLLHFLFPKWIARLKSRKLDFSRPLSLKKLNLKWHNLIGYIFVLFLVINTTAGMFLRPPLLIPIISSRVGIIPGSHLDTGNPWHDKFRRVVFDNHLQRYIFYTSDGFFFADKDLRNPFEPIPHQPQVSIMGCNILEKKEAGTYLVGSFSGLYLWNPLTGITTDYLTGQIAGPTVGLARPVGQNMAAGYLTDLKGNQFWFDYNQGAAAIRHQEIFPEMQQQIVKASPISIWNAALEVHTGRVFEHLIGPLYLLYVPIVGLTALIVLISGFLIWWYAYKGTKKQANPPSPEGQG